MEKPSSLKGGCFGTTIYFVMRRDVTWFSLQIVPQLHNSQENHTPVAIIPQLVVLLVGEITDKTMVFSSPPPIRIPLGHPWALGWNKGLPIPTRWCPRSIAFSW